LTQVFFQAHPKAGFEDYLKYVSDRGLGLEVTDFAFSDVLDSNWREILDRRRDALQGFAGTVSMHGVFMEITVHSHDRLIREVARERIRHNLDIAAELNARYIVFHSNYVSLITEPSYRSNWLERNAEFWSEMIGKYETIVMLENLWEETPATLQELMESVASPKLRVCLDTGHVNAFSEASMNDWLESVGKYIGYMHVHDNHGQRDEHLVPGKGYIDWQGFTATIRALGITPGVLFELDNLPDSIRSLEYFDKERIYPFDSRS
jgi:sugar phosphate isomerase/epimerase